jgi:hypothetical protein
MGFILLFSDLCYGKLEWLCHEKAILTTVKRPSLKYRVIVYKDWIGLSLRDGVICVSKFCIEGPHCYTNGNVR